MPYRSMNLRIVVDIWEWPNPTRPKELDLTGDVLRYQWQKSIKNPEGACSLSVVPQKDDTHILDVLKPMDVIRIYEFGTLKFIGYVIRVSYTGTIDPQSGNPNRSATVTCKQFGGLLQSSGIGFGLGYALGDGGSVSRPLLKAADKLSIKIEESIGDGTTFAELANLVIDAFIGYLEEIGAKNIHKYLETYLDLSSGLTSKETPGVPKSFELFNGDEQSISFWQVIDQLVERPFNELWIDNGPRDVSVDGNDISLPEKACLVFRPTPFNGSLDKNGSQEDRFDKLKTRKIDKSHLLRFDLTRSMDEIYNFYIVSDAAYRLNYYEKIATGETLVDKDLIGKYLLKPLNVELWYTDITKKEGEQSNYDAVRKNRVKTLQNWFRNNENYLSGAISMMVPSEHKLDPKIGDKIEVYGIEGHFYVEGVTHIWNYQGPLRSDLSITRGFNGDRPIELKDKIFMRNQLR